MDDTSLAQFASITGTKPETARQYLGFTDGDVQQAIELFFANDGADLHVPASSTAPSASHPPPVPDPSTRPHAGHQSRRDSDGIVHIDSDSDMEDADYPSAPTAHSIRQQPATGRTAIARHTPSGQTPPSFPSGSVDDDEAFARQLQQEMYGEAGPDGAMGPEGVRAPIARTTETLVGPDSFDPDDPDDMNAAVLQQIRARQRARPRGGLPLLQSTPSGYRLIETQIDRASSTNLQQAQYGVKSKRILLKIVTGLLELQRGPRKHLPNHEHWQKCTDRRLN